MTTIKTPYDAMRPGRPQWLKQEGYRQGVADTEARYKPLVEAAKDLDGRLLYLDIIDAQLSSIQLELQDALQVAKEAPDAS